MQPVNQEDKMAHLLPPASSHRNPAPVAFSVANKQAHLLPQTSSHHNPAPVAFSVASKQAHLLPPASNRLNPAPVAFSVAIKQAHLLPQASSHHNPAPVAFSVANERTSLLDKVEELFLKVATAKKMKAQIIENFSTSRILMFCMKSRLYQKIRRFQSLCGKLTTDEKPDFI